MQLLCSQCGTLVQTERTKHGLPTRICPRCGYSWIVNTVLDLLHQKNQKYEQTDLSQLFSLGEIAHLEQLKEKYRRQHEHDMSKMRQHSPGARPSQSVALPIRLPE